MTLAQEQIKNLSYIAKQTLGFAWQSDKPKPVDFVLLTESAVRIHQRAIREKRINLVKELSDGIVAEVYTGEMLQVVSNLIVNAVDALPTEGTLRLRLRKRQGIVEFVIADNGHGMLDCPILLYQLDR